MVMVGGPFSNYSAISFYLLIENTSFISFLGFFVFVVAVAVVDHAPVPGSNVYVIVGHPLDFNAALEVDGVTVPELAVIVVVAFLPLIAIVTEVTFSLSEISVSTEDLSCCTVGIIL